MLALFKTTPIILASSVKRQASSVKRQASSVKRQASSVKRQAQRRLISSQFSHKKPSITSSLPSILGGLFVVQNFLSSLTGGAK